MDIGGPIQGTYVKYETALSFSKEEAIVNNALLSALEAPELLRLRRSTLVPELFPPRLGYDRRERGILEVLGTGRFTGPDRRLDYSGAYGTYTGTSRPSIGQL